jgi:hypothetical protein
MHTPTQARNGCHSSESHTAYRTMFSATPLLRMGCARVFGTSVLRVATSRGALLPGNPSSLLLGSAPTRTNGSRTTLSPCLLASGKPVPFRIGSALTAPPAPSLSSSVITHTTFPSLLGAAGDSFGRWRWWFASVLWPCLLPLHSPPQQPHQHDCYDCQSCGWFPCSAGRFVARTSSF